VIAANYVFDPESQSIRNLERISHIAKSARAPFIAAANSQLLQGDSPDVAELQTFSAEASDAWDSLVRSSDASYLGLALPRFLLRLPYGSATEPAERFNFEEMPEDIGARHESYLWGNPAFAVVYLLGKAFSESGWNFRPGDFQEIEGLPLHVSTNEGETEIKPCAEVLMTVRVAEEIIDCGLMPLISMKETDTVRVGIFQSVAGTRLEGSWDQA
jgi:type VI secretion system protein ImpC